VIMPRLGIDIIRDTPGGNIRQSPRGIIRESGFTPQKCLVLSHAERRAGGDECPTRSSV